MRAEPVTVNTAGRTRCCASATSPGSPSRRSSPCSAGKGRLRSSFSDGSHSPRSGSCPYFVTLAPYGFYWFELVATAGGSRVTNDLPEGLEELLPAYLAAQRWYAGAADPPAETVPRGARPRAVVSRRGPASAVARHRDLGRRPISVPSRGAAGRGARRLPARTRGGGASGRSGTPTSTTPPWTPRWPRSLLEVVSGRPGVRQAGPAHLAAEQCNTSIVYDDRLILKVFRRLHAGRNPDVEVTTSLADVRVRACGRPAGDVAGPRIRPGFRAAVPRRWLGGLGSGPHVPARPVQRLQRPPGRGRRRLRRGSEPARSHDGRHAHRAGGGIRDRAPVRRGGHLGPVGRRFPGAPGCRERAGGQRSPRRSQGAAGPAPERRGSRAVLPGSRGLSPWSGHAHRHGLVRARLRG